MMILSRLAPALALIALVLVCALPWGLPAEARLVLPMLPYVLIHRLVERDGGAMPDWLVFLAGFATDVVGQGPLGYWSLIYLCGYTMIRSATANQPRGALASICLFEITIACLALMQWSVASIYYLRRVDMHPLAVAAAASSAAYLLLLLLLPQRNGQPQRTNNRLERGL